MTRLILLNGMPGVGKSTIARRFVAEHHGTLMCDVDVLRTFIGGWSDDFCSMNRIPPWRENADQPRRNDQQIPAMAGK